MRKYFRFGNADWVFNFLLEQASGTKMCLENFGLPFESAWAQAAPKAENLTERKGLDSSLAALPPESRSNHVCLRLHKLIRHLILPLSAPGIAKKDEKEQQVKEVWREREHRLVRKTRIHSLRHKSYTQCKHTSQTGKTLK